MSSGPDAVRASLSNRETDQWTSWREIPGFLAQPPRLVQSLAVMVVVGTILFAINQAGVVLSGRATGATWVRVGLTYVVPFCVSNYGMLVGGHRAEDPET